MPIRFRPSGPRLIFREIAAAILVFVCAGLTGYGAARASWWPAWVAAFAVALISYTQGRDVAIVPEIIDRVHPSNNPGIFFIAVLVSLIVFTTTKLRGIYSVVTHRVQQSN